MRFHLIFDGKPSSFFSRFFCEQDETANEFVRESMYLWVPPFWHHHKGKVHNNSMLYTNDNLYLMSYREAHRRCWLPYFIIIKDTDTLPCGSSNRLATNYFQLVYWHFFKIKVEPLRLSNLFFWCSLRELAFFMFVSLKDLLIRCGSSWLLLLI